MSSIRPLAIITVLTVLCVFLYFKINETEPVLPADVAEWSMSPGLEIGGAVPSESSAPSFGSTPTVNTTAPAFGSFPTGNEAPVFANPVPQESFLPAVAETDTELETANLPPMPTIPATDGLVASTTQAESASLVSPTTPQATNSFPPTTAPLTSDLEPAPQASLFAATRIIVQAALDRGELSQALLLLSDWHGDPSLNQPEKTEVDGLLSQLAGSVIYSTQHRLEPPHMVQAGEKLQEIAKQYNVPWQLLAKINGLTSPTDLRPGQQLKVLQGPFSALIDLSEQKMTIMLQRRYAGQFDIAVAPQSTVEEGRWQVDQKLTTPNNPAALQAHMPATTEEHSLVLSNPSAASGQVAILHGSNASAAVDPAMPQKRAIRLNASGMGDVFDILSVGSRIVIRR